MFPFFFPFQNQDVIPSELGVLLTAVLVAAAIAILLVGRREDDATEGRLALRYLGVICIITLFVTLFATFNAVRALTDLVVDHAERAQQHAVHFDVNNPDTIFDSVRSTFDDALRPGYVTATDNNANYTAAVQSALVALTAGAVFAFHYRWRRQLADAAADRSPARRVERTYLYGVCLVGALIAAYAAARSLFGVYQIIFPGTAAAGSSDVTRAEGISSLLSYGLLAAGAGAIFWSGWTRVAPAAAPATKRSPAKKATKAGRATR